MPGDARFIFAMLLLAVSSLAQNVVNDDLSQLLNGTRAAPVAFRLFRQRPEWGLRTRAHRQLHCRGGPPEAPLAAALRRVSPYFDRAPVIVSAVGDVQDQQVQAFFRGVYQGAPRARLMVVTAAGWNWRAAVLFDRENLFARSLPVLAKSMAASMPRPQGGAEVRQSPVSLQRTQLPMAAAGSAWPRAGASRGPSKAPWTPWGRTARPCRWEAISRS